MSASTYRKAMKPPTGPNNRYEIRPGTSKPTRAPSRIRAVGVSRSV